LGGGGRGEFSDYVIERLSDFLSECRGAIADCHDNRLITQSPNRQAISANPPDPAA
jgi:hypothetical protein